MTAEFLLSKQSKETQGPNFIDKKLSSLVHGGIGYHHAGLAYEDRRFVENLFSTEKIKVLCATSTLATGVNLPAHLVIIKSTMQYSPKGYQEYSEIGMLQMIGRAGRPQVTLMGSSPYCELIGCSLTSSEWP